MTIPIIRVHAVPFQLLKSEPLADGVARVINELLDDAGAQLADKDIHPDTAVRDARKNVKKLRALLRLIRPALNNKTFKRHNNRLQRFGQQLGNTRVSAALPDTLQKLTDHFSVMLDDTALEPVRKSLARRHSLALQQQVSGLDLTGTRKQLAGLAQQLAGLDLEQLSRKTLKTGIRKTCLRCQRALEKLRSSPTTQNSHHFRRQVKSLWYQLRLLRKHTYIKPLRLTDTLRDIEQTLGQDNDLAVLIETLHDYPEISCNPVRRELLISLAETRRIVLLSRALRLATPVFTGKPGSFTG